MLVAHRSNRFVLTAVAVCLGASLTGCGSQQSSAEPSTSQTSSSDASGTGAGADVPSPTGDPSFPSTDTLAGSIRTQAQGTAVTETWRVGEAESGSPSGEMPADIPSDAVASCNADSAEGVAMSVYVPATVAVTYHGRMVVQAGLNRNALVGSPPSGVIAYEVDGQWDCGSESAPQVNLQPGQTRTFEALVVDQILGNTHPTLTHQDVQGLAVGGAVVDPDLVTALRHPSGPGALCNPQDPQGQVLFLFRRGARNADCEGMFN